mmetsp:Transcript_7770/g.14838  ORF Transcript_7770/g.14838 Transcript_7770/m.14838 type:complete len:305 (-) Transcript_7770:32-946(-)|eukprot:CAMPEP_0204902734 /NCGR_PEP_ID=MMETSP1397-20131031/3844_1 /ASSEMBLY_ACC=CAM_ASM_000891 /TAXON_ID=49980 /ORGANISM="Climacostomum Climacostomum virens, Strain Stock W-24" /LENGTH=304 /DNA_ID=CAMNT_0052071283 /DNA_START=6 /DNA_END=920 /DNA_ORIENTATION=-
MAVTLAELRGHRDSVNSVSIYENSLASGSDDGTVRLWDLRRNLTMMRVTDPSFAKRDPVSNVHLASEHKLYCSVANKLYLFDLRKAHSVSLAESEGIIAHTLDEINQIAYRDSKVVMPDDNGTLTFLDTDVFSFALESVHTNICSSFAFSPDSTKGISGDYDSVALLIDVESGRIEKRLILDQVVGKSSVNPPYICSVDWSANGVALALGDGHVVIYDEDCYESPSIILEAHLSRVFFTAWANFASNFLLTISNDPNIAVWEGDEMLIRVELPDKPNWVESSWSAPCVYVADTSAHIRILTFPS